MGENSKIAWTDHTFNPWVGCDKVGEGCDNCYAEGWAKRAGEPGLWNGERRKTKTWHNPRMHLDREQAAMLAERLQRFAETGEL